MLKSQDETEVSDSACARWQDSHSRTRIKQLTKGALLALISVGVSLITFRYLCVPLLEYTYPESRKFLLDSGIYGAYPSKKYVSTNLASPQANVVQTDDSCADNLVLLSVGGQSVTDGGPMILDMSGNLVWSAPGQYGDASANTKIQRYRGRDYLTFWAGENCRNRGWVDTTCSIPPTILYTEYRWWMRVWRVIFTSSRSPKTALRS